MDQTGSQFRALQYQESTIIRVNLVVLLVLLGVLFAFSEALDWTPVAVTTLLVARFIEQVFELQWLRTRAALSARALKLYSVATLVLHVAFASAVSMVAAFDHSHFVVLFFVPVIAGAFRLSWGWLGLLVAVVCGLTFLEVFLESQRGGTTPSHEYYENSVVCMAYLMVAFIVRRLAHQLEAREAELASSLNTLQVTQDKLLHEERLGAVGRLAGALAHEIRNPVTLISSTLAMSEGDDLEDLRSRMTPEIARLERLTTDFLVYARGKSPERDLTPLSTSLEYVASLCRAKASELNVSIAVKCPNDLVAYADAHMLHQALLNLGLNAIQASKAGDEVALSAETQGQDIVLRVTNTGPAIPPDALPRLFEPFFSTKRGGTGLGLAISRSIAEAHGGSLTLEENSAERVCFAISLPGALRSVV